MPSVAEVRSARWPVRTLVLGLVAVLVSLDQLLKEWALANLTLNQPQPFIGELLQLRLIFNSGAAFGMGTGLTWIFSLLAIVATIVIVVVILPRLQHLGWAVAIASILSGIVGNLGDRLFRPPGPLFGEVVDYLQLPNWPIFNLADMCLTLGAVAVVALSFLSRRGLDGQPVKHEETRSTEGVS